MTDVVNEPCELLTALNELRCNDGDIDIYDIDESVWEVTEEGDWTQDHKYQSSESILTHIESGRHFCLSRNRSGSYHTDWYYGEAHVCEVKPVTETVTITKWVGV